MSVSIEHIILLVILMFMGIGLPVHLGLRHEKWKRDLEHKERMKALELGRTLPGDERWSSAAWLSLAIGAGVPLGVFLAAALASLAIGPGHEESIWKSAMVVGLSAVLGGAAIACSTVTRRGELSETNTVQKPVAFEDALDMVSSRS